VRVSYPADAPAVAVWTGRFNGHESIEPGAPPTSRFPRPCVPRPHRLRRRRRTPGPPGNRARRRLWRIFPADVPHGFDLAASSSRLCSSRRLKAVWKSAGVRPPQKIRREDRRSRIVDRGWKKKNCALHPRSTITVLDKRTAQRHPPPFMLRDKFRVDRRGICRGCAGCRVDHDGSTHSEIHWHE